MSHYDTLDRVVSVELADEAWCQDSEKSRPPRQCSPTNTVMMTGNVWQGNPHPRDDNFTVNVDTLNIVMGGKNMLFETMSSRKDVHQMKVENKAIYLQILPDLASKDTDVLQILPSNFIMDNNTRVISDTLKVRVYDGG